ncbi:hypothetical protein [Halomontanus rarus]|uniref:hypothetical protein n=1 Tax=Halomontanus rarus TaxID=3034020 RepID=UPI0023E870D6|nr:hypothetical protein [Halovivax sp. TS33]
MTLTSSYAWNVRFDLGGVTFEGPGMETKREAESIKNIVEADANADVDVEVFKQ